MLTKVEARNTAGNVLILPLQDISGGYTLKDVGGLDPVKATIVTSSFANRDGVEYETSKREARNVILKLGFAPDWVATTPKALRDNLYNWFMTKRHTELRFYEDTGLIVSIVGRVESNDSPRFTAEPDATISVICPLPDFIGMTTNVVSLDTVSGSSETDLTYPGTSETGFLFTLNVDRDISGFTLFQRGDDNVQYTLEFDATLLEGDVLKISTVEGNKYATVTRSGLDIDILYGIAPGSPWINLSPGLNKIRVQISGDPIPYTLTYTDKYGGL